MTEPSPPHPARNAPPRPRQLPTHSHQERAPFLPGHPHHFLTSHALAPEPIEPVELARMAATAVPATAPKPREKR